jgi:hypothetical protein
MGVDSSHDSAYILVKLAISEVLPEKDLSSE